MIGSDHPTVNRRIKRWWQVPVVGCVIGTGGYMITNDPNTWTWSKGIGVCGVGALSAISGRYSGGRRKRSPFYSQEKKRDVFDCNMMALTFLSTDRNNDHRIEFAELNIQSSVNVTDAQKYFATKDLNQNDYLDPEEIHPCLTTAQLSKSKRVKRCASPGCGTYTVYV
jgi:hypothetical protein